MYVVRLLVMNVDDGCNVFMSKMLESKDVEIFDFASFVRFYFFLFETKNSDEMYTIRMR